MCQLSAEIRRKDKWWDRFQDPDVREEWTREAREQVRRIRTPSAVVDVQLSGKQVSMSCRRCTMAHPVKKPD